MTQEKKKQKNPRARFGGFNTYGSRKAKSRKNEERLVPEKTKEKKSEKFSLLQRKLAMTKTRTQKRILNKLRKPEMTEPDQHAKLYSTLPPQKTGLTWPERKEKKRHQRRGLTVPPGK